MNSDTDSFIMVPLYSNLPKPAGYFSLERESSICSLTLDQFQHHMGESGKNVASMNMEEFISNIWAAEGSRSITAGATPSSEGKLPKRPSLPKQESLNLPHPLCRKMVDEVWFEIQKDQLQQQLEVQQGPNSGCVATIPRHKMTREDFLIKAVVVRENTASTLSVDRNSSVEPDLGQVLELGYCEQITGGGEWRGDVTSFGRVTGVRMPIVQHQDGVDDTGVKKTADNGCLGGIAGDGGMPVSQFTHRRWTQAYLHEQDGEFPTSPPRNMAFTW